MLTGTPLAEWEGIPVMPDAIAGEGDSDGYSYTVQGTPEEVQSFYKTEMAKLGWKLLGAGQGETKAILLIFTKGSGTASAMIIPQPEGLIYVMIVK